MKNIIELKYHKNSKQEIVFENLNEVKENDNVVLRLKDGDLTPLFYLHNFLSLCKRSGVVDRNTNLYIPCLPANYDVLNGINSVLYLQYNYIYSLDCYEVLKPLKNILPEWNIPEDSAVLFLSEDDCNRYEYLYTGRCQDDWDDHKETDGKITKLGLTLKNLTNSDGVPISRQNIISNDTFFGFEYEYAKKVSLILPQLHAEDKDCKYHIENINKVGKKIYEMTGVKPDLYVGHCFISENDLMYKHGITKIKALQKTFSDMVFINKITTTNSTDILEVQDNERLKVIDCVEFFKEHLDV